MNHEKNIKQTKMTTFLTVSLLGFLSLVSGTYLNVVRQDSSNKGWFEKYDTTHAQKALEPASDVASFTFSWPLIQMTSNTKDHELYAVTYPSDAPGAVLFHLNKDLQLINKWDNVSFSYFDLQYSNTQETLYGIYVSSTYGRVLSNFTLDAEAKTIAVDQLFTLPYMWYVNASSFDQTSNRYFALINYFPGHPESTLDQQLVLADFSQDSKVVEPKVSVSLITKSQGILQFIAYSFTAKELFYAGMASNQNLAIVGRINPENGEVKDVLWSSPAEAVGPIVVDDQSKTFTVYTKTTNSEGTVWHLWSFPLEIPHVGSLRGTLLGTYLGSSYRFFAAASIGSQ